MESIVEYATMEYHDNLLDFQYTDPFGVIKIKMKPNTGTILINYHFVFTIDISGSMHDLHKMDYLLFTLENMLHIFSEKSNISIYINVFNETVETLISNTIVTKENIDSLINKLKEIRPLKGTNIEQALNAATEYTQQYKMLNPDHKITHILLTDGIATFGNQNPTYLKTLVDDTYANIFIGYGSDHNPIFMNELASNKNGSYFFIDAFEKAGQIYGEIIHNSLNTLIENVTIHMLNSKVYDYITNTWESSLYIGNLVSETEKIYQIYSLEPAKSLYIVQGKNYSINNLVHQFSSFPTFHHDLTKYIFRQKTQELLYETNQYALTNRPTRLKRGNDDVLETNKEEIKYKLKNCIEKMLSYINRNSLENDKFMNMLFNDLDINYKMIDSHKLALYSCARQTSQGRQTSYTVSLETETSESPYATESVLNTMTQMKTCKY